MRLRIALSLAVLWAAFLLGAEGQIINGGGGGVSTAAGVVALFSTCSGVQYLGADGACHNAAGGFTAPTSWAAATGNWTAGTDALTVTSTRTCGAATTCFLEQFNLTATAVAGSDVRVFQVTPTISGAANIGSTWGATYNQGIYNVTSGTGLTHGLHDIQRATFTSTAGILTDLAATGYYTAGLLNANGPFNDIQIMHLEWDLTESGTGAFTNGMTGLSVSMPGAITGSPTIPGVAGIKIGDPTGASVPGTAKVGLSVGGFPGSGTYGIYIPTPAGTWTNPIAVGGTVPVYFQPGLITGALASFHGSLSANTKIEVSSSSTDAMIGYYNANGSLWEVGILNGAAGEFAIKDTANSLTMLKITKSTGVATWNSYKSTTGTRFLCVDSSGVMTASASACSGT